MIESKLFSGKERSLLISATLAVCLGVTACNASGENVKRPTPSSAQTLSDTKVAKQQQAWEDYLENIAAREKKELDTALKKGLQGVPTHQRPALSLGIIVATYCDEFTSPEWADNDPDVDYAPYEKEYDAVYPAYVESKMLDAPGKRWDPSFINAASLACDEPMASHYVTDPNESVE